MRVVQHLLELVPVGLKRGQHGDGTGGEGGGTLLPGRGLLRLGPPPWLLHWLDGRWKRVGISSATDEIIVVNI